MPALMITVTRQDDQPLRDALKAEFGDGGGTIGRGNDCTLVLPDPERQISRTHARIAMRGSDFVLHDEGSAIPVVINGEPLGKGRNNVIRAGDEILIGPYAMRVDAPAPQVDLNATIIGGRSPLAPKIDLPPSTAPADLSMIGTVLSW